MEPREKDVPSGAWNVLGTDGGWAAARPFAGVAPEEEELDGPLEVNERPG
jgi:hypothetical protein